MKKKLILIFIFIMFFSMIFGTFIEKNDIFDFKKVKEIIDDKEIIFNDDNKYIVVFNDEGLFQKNEKNKNKINSFQYQNLRKNFLEEHKKNKNEILGLLDKGNNQFSNTPLREYTNLFSGLAIEINDKNTYDEIKIHPNVKAIYPDIKYELFVKESTMDFLNVTDIWKMDMDGINLTGDGIIVSVLDTGYDITLEDFGSCVSFSECPKVLDAFDFPNNDPNPFDINGHGTHVASTIASEHSNPDFKGIAPDSKLYLYNVFTQTGSGIGAYPSDIIAALERSIDPNGNGDFSDKAHIISMSLGSSFAHPDDLLSSKIDELSQYDVIVVIAAGNDGGEGYFTLASPGTSRTAITVGATFKDYESYGSQTGKPDDIAYFSSRGPTSIGTIKPDIVAPGVNICAGKAQGKYNSLPTCGDSNYVLLSGTSMATPIVSGVVALIKQAKPHWTTKQIKSSLKATAKKLNESPMAQGWGRIEPTNVINLENPACIVEFDTSNFTSYKYFSDSLTVNAFIECPSFSHYELNLTLLDNNFEIINSTMILNGTLQNEIELQIPLNIYDFQYKALIELNTYDLNNSYDNYDMFYAQYLNSSNLNSCFSINKSGNYSLIDDVYFNDYFGICIDVETDNVKLDCKGNKISSIGSIFDAAIYTNGNNITIENCIFENFYYGFIAENMTNSYLNNLTATNTFVGILLNNNNNVNMSQIYTTQNYFDLILYESQNLFLKDFVLEGIIYDSMGIYLYDTIDSYFENVSINNYSIGAMLLDSINNIFNKSIFENNNQSLIFDNSYNNLIINNLFQNNILDSSFNDNSTNNTFIKNYFTDIGKFNFFNNNNNINFNSSIFGVNIGNYWQNFSCTEFKTSQNYNICTIPSQKIINESINIVDNKPLIEIYNDSVEINVSSPQSENVVLNRLSLPINISFYNFYETFSGDITMDLNITSLIYKLDGKEFIITNKLISNVLITDIDLLNYNHTNISFYLKYDQDKKYNFTLPLNISVNLTNLSDNLIGNVSNINTNIDDLSIKVNDSDNLSQEFDGFIKIFFENQNITLVEFEHNFSNNPIDLSMITFKKDEIENNSKIYIRGINLDENETKTMYLNLRGNLSKFGSICIKDEEVFSFSDFSLSCNSENEIYVHTIPYVNENYIVSFMENSTILKISGLSHSGVSQMCTEDWTFEFSSWSTCSGGTQFKLPIDKNDCGTQFSKPDPLTQLCTVPSSGGGGGGGGSTPARVTVISKNESQEIVSNSIFKPFNSALNVSVNESAVLKDAYTGINKVSIKDEYSNVLIFFDFNFSKSHLNMSSLEIKMGTTTNRTYMVISGLEEDITKTIMLKRNIDSNKVCIKDALVNDIVEVSLNCDGINEVLLFCDTYINPDYTCTIKDDYYEITGLKHSAVIEYEEIVGIQIMSTDNEHDDLKIETNSLDAIETENNILNAIDDNDVISQANSNLKWIVNLVLFFMIIISIFILITKFKNKFNSQKTHMETNIEKKYFCNIELRKKVKAYILKNKDKYPKDKIYKTLEDVNVSKEMIDDIYEEIKGIGE